MSGLNTIIGLNMMVVTQVAVNPFVSYIVDNDSEFRDAGQDASSSKVVAKQLLHKHGGASNFSQYMNTVPTVGRPISWLS